MTEKRRFYYLITALVTLAFTILAWHHLSLRNFRNAALHPGDIIFMISKKNENIAHVVIYQPNLVDDKNIIGTVLSGVAYSNLKKHLTALGCYPKIFRYNPKSMSEAKKLTIRGKIGQQALYWFTRLKKEPMRNFYRYDAFYHYLVAKHSVESVKPIGFDEQTIKQYKSQLDFLQQAEPKKKINTLFHIKYGVRKNTLPTLNKGLTCSQFVIICIGSTLLEDTLKPYMLADKAWHEPAIHLYTFWPSIKYLAPQEKDQELPPFYQKAFDLSHMKKPSAYNKNKFQQLLILEYPSLSIESAQKHVRDMDMIQKIKCKKISLVAYLQMKNTTLQAVVSASQKALDDFSHLNPKFSSIADVYLEMQSQKEVWQCIE